MVGLADIKNWNVDLETEITAKWKEAEQFAFDPSTDKPIYSIDTPPPYVNAPIHMGHAVTYSFMDMFARYKRMKGFEVLFPLGLDNNGLPIEVGAEKKYKISALHTPREEFLEYCKKLLTEGGMQSVDSFARLGISFNSYQEGEAIGSMYKTDDPRYRALTQKTFVDLFKKGEIYEDVRINNWDPKLQTTIAASEIEYEERPSTFNDIAWTIKETGEEVVIGTTRPELIPSCGMVIFNPEDERYTHLAGKTAVSPIFEKEIPIMSHPSAVIDKGTGLVMMCSAGDVTDIAFFRELQLKPIISIAMDGKMNAHAGKYEGLKVRDARASILEDIKEAGLLKKQEEIIHKTPISDRSKAEIEFIEMPEFYLKQVEIKEEIRRIAKDDIRFFPDSSRKILESWIDSVSIDWPISRRRFYATEIPIWHSDLKGKKVVALPTVMKYYQPWREDVPQDAQVILNGKVLGIVSDSEFSGLTWTGETRVFDTWMDSSISELFMLRYKLDDEFFAKSYPATLRPQGKEIIRTWLYYTLLRGYLETGKAAFNDVWIHQHIMDSKGRKMSKSVGNVVDPQDLLRNYGAEAIRMWAATEGDLSKGDFSCNIEKISGERKTLNKFLNVAKFVSLFDKPKAKPKITSVDELFIDYIHDLTDKVDAFYSGYDFNHPSQDLRRFLWDIFASHYIELVKNRAYNEEGNFSEPESESARYTLYYLLERLALLLYPVIPQITSVIGDSLGINYHAATWPKSVAGKSDLSKVEELMAFSADVWKQKKDAGISLREGIEGISIPEGLIDYTADLTACHKI
ncbi:MAG: valyl-tRNA synthetase [Patescibacteria group bacterium]|jgi:valyl-tRNA synthetase